MDCQEFIMHYRFGIKANFDCFHELRSILMICQEMVSKLPTELAGQEENVCSYEIYS